LYSSRRTKIVADVDVLFLDGDAAGGDVREMKRRQHGQNVIMMRMSGGGSSCSHCDPDIYVHKLALDKELVQMLLYTTIQAKTYNI